MGAMGAAAPFLLGSAGAGASGLIQGRRQADEHAQLMQMLAMQQAREGREQGLYPGELQAQSQRNALGAQELDYQKQVEPYKIETEKGNARAVNEPYATPSDSYMSAIKQALPPSMQGINFGGLNNLEMGRVASTGLQTNEQNVQMSRVSALARQAITDKATRDIISVHAKNQDAYEKALHEQSAYEQSLLSPGQGVTKPENEIAADRQRLQSRVNVAKAARDASEAEVERAMNTLMQQSMNGVGGLMQGGGLGLPGVPAAPVPTSAALPFTPKKYTVSPDQ